MAIARTNINYIDSLLKFQSWTGNANTATTVSYNFSIGASYGVGVPTGMQGYYTAALQQWSNVANISFVRSNSTNENQPGIAFAYGDLDADFGTGTLGVTYTIATVGSRINQMLTVLDTDYFPTAASFAPGTRGFSTLLHEIGHALGLEHPRAYAGTENAPHLTAGEDTFQNTVMSYYDGVLVSDTVNPPSGPMIYDIAAIQYLYGANRAYNSGNTVYNFTGAMATRTIWDGGGVDTISASGAAAGSAIDLREGINYYSHIGSAYVWNAFGTNIENATGSGFADTMTGNRLINTIAGNAGNDTINGHEGADNLSGNDGNDSINGGVDADFIYGNIGNDIINGNDIIYSDNTTISFGHDLIHGDNGNDLLITSQGDDTAYGDGGNDTINLADGSDVGYGGIGNDYLAGGNNNDTLYGDAGNDTLYGNLGDDQISGGEGADTIYSDNSTVSFGHDLVYGDGGDDMLIVSQGNDTVYGGTGIDRLYLGDGADIGDGGDGNDLLYGGNNNDTLTGGLGNDSFFFSAGGGNDMVTDFTGGGVVGGDIIRLATLNMNGSTYSSLADLVSRITYTNGTTAHINFNGHEITLVADARLTTGDFLIG